MRYFPLTTDRFEHQFGIRALASSDSIIDATDAYELEITLRRDAFERDQPYYFQALKKSQAAQRDACDLIIESAAFLNAGRNLRTGETLDLGDDQPLLDISRHVQEDLAIMSGDAEAGFPMIAGAVAFPSGWCVGDKIGKSLMAIHEGVPEFAPQLNRATQQLLSRLKHGRSVWRMNWGVRPSAQLDQSPIHDQKLDDQRRMLSSQSIGKSGYFRVERQTLSRLAGGDILFTIHTHQCALNQLDANQQSNLRGVILTCPDETLRYKGILPVRDLLLDFLNDASQTA